jgi:iron complex outermembrane recepter protein
MFQWRGIALLVCTGTCSFMWATFSQAQTASAGDDKGGRLEEIVVTANKHSENAQNVPIAISTVSETALTQAGVGSTLDLGMKVAGLTMESGFNGLQPHIRGIGTTAVSSGNESSVATYIDGIYIAVMSGGMLSLNNIAQVDVLKGPQGTLFGRNATGGVINVRTKDPTQDLHIDASATYGNYRTESGNVYITGGLTKDLAVDFAAYGSHQGKGYGTNFTTGDQVNRTEEYALRTKWLYTPTDDLQIRFSADTSSINDDGLSAYTLVPGTAVNRPGQAPYVQNNSNPWDTDNAYNPVFIFRQSGVGATVDYDAPFAKLTSITGYRTSHKDNAWGVLPTPDPVEAAGWIEKSDQFSQELQIASLPSSPITWVGGAYYLHARVGYQPFTITGPIIAPLNELAWRDYQTTDAKALYGQASAPIYENTHLTLGFRYSIERRAITGEESFDFSPASGIPSFVELTDANKLFKKPTWRVALDHQFTPTFLAYVSFNTGFKSGVYESIPPSGPGATPVKPESITAYEVGIKTDLFDRTVRFNAAAFLYDYKEIQVNIFNSISTILENGAGARLYGFDFDLTAKPVDRLTLDLSGAYVHDRFTSFPNGSITTSIPFADGGGRAGSSGDLAGNRLPYTPDFTATAGVTYEVPVADGGVMFNVNYAYEDGWYFGADNSNLRQPAFSTVNGQITWKIGNSGAEFGLWGKNLTDSAHATFFNYANNPYGYSDRILTPPRTFGIRVGYHM